MTVLPAMLLRLLAIAMLSVGCSAKDVIADLALEPTAPTGEKPTDAGTSTLDAGPRAAFCASAGPDLPRIDQTETPQPICGAQVASHTFRYAICSCRDLTFIGVLETDDFDSARGPYVEREDDGGTANDAHTTGAAVGVNQAMNASAGLDIGGSLTVAGADGLTWPASSPQVRSDLRVHGDLNYVGTIGVKRDAWIEGDLLGGGTLDVGRNLHQPASSSRTLLIAPEVQGMDVRSDFVVEPPCPCAPEQRIDIEAIVAEGKQHNHNLETGISPDQLRQRSADLTIELECGRYYLSEISGNGKVKLVTRGRTALFVAGNLTITDDFEVDLGDSGQLDLFVAGNLDFANPATLGDRRRPAGVRIYVGGNQPLSLIGELAIGANLYAPNVSVSLGAGLSIHGSLFAADISSFGDFSIHYDRAVQRMGEACEAQGLTCASCEECPASLACVEGRCAACRSDADCCLPLACNAGVCGAPPP